ncbi:MAG: RagB/SusD family nutrient uptake outer membrane protein [Ferruginibacter sp.]
MKIKNITPYFFAASFLLSMASCKKFTDLKPISLATTANAYNTAQDAEGALIGAYESFRSQEYYIWDNVVLGDVIADNYYAGGDDINIIAIDKLNFLADNPRLLRNWNSLYNAILKVNIVSDKVPNIQDAKLDVGNRRAQILGEAAFLRAYNYYQLVTLFGGVPVITSPITSTDPSATNVPKSTEEEVYTQIIKDLEFAANNLPDKYSGDISISKGRATKGAANALLAKAYAQKPAKDYNKVLQYCNGVINSPIGYKLLNNYDFLFDGNHYNNEESILEAQFTGTQGGNGNYGSSLLLPPSITIDTWRKFITPSHDLVNAFDAAGDNVRKNASIKWESAPWIDEYWENKINAVIPFSYKWRSKANWDNSTSRQYMLRLADIILLKAEAMNELNQPVANVKAILLQVRQRVNLGDVAATNQADLRTAILNERRLELAQEGQRWNDLKRYGLAVQTMNKLNEIDLRTNTKTNYNATATKLLLPIPQQELDRNSKLVQNTGY